MKEMALEPDTVEVDPATGQPWGRDRPPSRFKLARQERRFLSRYLNRLRHERREHRGKKIASPWQRDSAVVNCRVKKRCPSRHGTSSLASVFQAHGRIYTSHSRRRRDDQHSGDAAVCVPTITTMHNRKIDFHLAQSSRIPSKTRYYKYGS